MSEESKVFPPGSVVQLNSGSPPLTVVRGNAETTLVAWIDDNGRPQEYTFSTVCLKEH